MEVVGYSNSNNYFPSPLVTFAKNKQSYYAFFPSGRSVNIDNFEEIQQEIPHYINERKNLSIKYGEYAYGIDRDEILIGKPQKLYSQLENMLKAVSLNTEQYDLISDFLENTQQDKKATWSDYIELVHDIPTIRILITERRIKNSEDNTPLAERIIVQLKKNTGFKNCLRKNLYVGQSYKNTIMKNPFVDEMVSVFA